MLYAVTQDTFLPILNNSWLTFSSHLHITY